MSIERRIEDCNGFLNKIKQYEPDPYYVGYFLDEFIKTINYIYDEIFEEANRNFGLYENGDNSEERFEEMSIIKNDKNAIEFSKWFKKIDEREHEKPYPNFMKQLCILKKQDKQLPKLKIMLRPKERFKDDIFQEINPRLSNGKLSSKEELKIEISRQLSVYFEIINHKRKQRNEPKVGKEQIVPSVFLMLDGGQDIEISYAVEIYMPVIERLIDECRKKIKELTTWK
ncbi:hypothetical protein [Nitrosopumilus sp.]|uniref:hypothetical protein n=1 Tax=Nitrosopumilus sp. TaxID=2024843 RepID=UPI0026035EB5|nr:hypothetical protein [Nitrosopumilus sp.]